MGVAKMLGIDPRTLANWDKGRAEPLVQYYPGITNVLGQCPCEWPDTFGEKLALHRKYRGLSRRDLVKKTGVDAGSIVRWEAGERIPAERAPEFLRRFFSASITWGQLMPDGKALSPDGLHLEKEYLSF